MFSHSPYLIGLLPKNLSLCISYLTTVLNHMKHDDTRRQCLRLLRSALHEFALQRAQPWLLPPKALLVELNSGHSIISIRVNGGNMVCIRQQQIGPLEKILRDIGTTESYLYENPESMFL